MTIKEKEKEVGFNILKNENQKEQYIQRTFNSEGYMHVYNFTRSLCKMYVRKKDNDYPFRIGVVLGIPAMKYAQVINNKEDLKSRIIAYMHLLGLKEFKIEDERGTIEVTFEDLEKQYDGIKQ